MRFLQLSTLLVVFLLPFFPWQLDSKIVYAIYALAILTGPLFLKTVKKHLQEADAPTFFFLFFLLASLVSTLFSQSFPTSLKTFFLYLAYFVIFTTSSQIFPQKKDWERLAATIIVLSVPLALISFYNTFFLHQVSRQHINFYQVYYGHNHLSALLLFSIPAVFYFLETYWSKKLLRFSLLFLQGIFFLSFVFTFARASFLSLLLAFGLTLTLTKPFSKFKVAAIILTIIVLVGFTFSSLVNEKSFGVTKHATPWQSRSVYWQAAFEQIKQDPFTGLGIGTFQISGKNVPPTNDPHNFFLKMAAEAGVVGLVSSLALIFLILRQSSLASGKNLLSLTLWISLLASSINNLVDFDWQLPAVFVIFWLIASLTIKTKQFSAKKDF